MSHVTVLLVSSAILLAGCSQNSDSLKKALVGATLIDGSGAVAIPNAVIVIDGEQITAAGADPATKVPDGFAKVNVGGKFIMPGLIDAHVTINSDKDQAATQGKAYLAAGITTVGADTVVPDFGPRVFPSLGKHAGIADQVIASNGTAPEATLAKIERMAKAEIPSMQIIQAATKNAAAWLEQANLGAVQAGQKADLLILNADPSVDVKNLRQIYRVMIDGRWVSLK